MGNSRVRAWRDRAVGRPARILPTPGACSLASYGTSRDKIFYYENLRLECHLRLLTGNIRLPVSREAGNRLSTPGHTALVKRPRRAPVYLLCQQSKTRRDREYFCSGCTGTGARCILGVAVDLYWIVSDSI